MLTPAKTWRDRLLLVDDSDEAELMRGYEQIVKDIQHETIENAASVCELMVIGGRAWNHDQEIAAKTLFSASENIKKLAQ